MAPPGLLPEPGSGRVYRHRVAERCDLAARAARRHRFRARGLGFAHPRAGWPRTLGTASLAGCGGSTTRTPPLHGACSRFSSRARAHRLPRGGRHPCVRRGRPLLGRRGLGVRGGASRRAGMDRGGPRGDRRGWPAGAGARRGPILVRVELSRGGDTISYEGLEVARRIGVPTTDIVEAHLRANPGDGSAWYGFLVGANAATLERALAVARASLRSTTSPPALRSTWIGRPRCTGRPPISSRR